MLLLPGCSVTFPHGLTSRSLFRYWFVSDNTHIIPVVCEEVQIQPTNFLHRTATADRRKRRHESEQGRQFSCNVIPRSIRVTIVAVEKQYVLHILSMCLQPQVHSMQCASAIFLSVACPAVQNVSTLSHKRYDFRQDVTEHKIYVDFLRKFILKYFSS